jgi:hypothetical protein
MQVRGTTADVINGESLEGIDDIIKSISKRKKKKRSPEEDEDEPIEIPES